ncbi:MAG: hypothetical protein ACK45I_05710 [Bacteroidota bacterium]
MKQLILLSAIFLSFKTSVKDEFPAVNTKVIEYVNSVMGKQVGRGECWDLAAEALDYAGAKWDAPYGFGKKYSCKAAQILPGDIIQLSHVTMEKKTEKEIMRWKMLKHTAVVYEVKPQGEIVIAEQNVDGVRKVMTNTWNLNNVKTGTMDFYRPQPQ